MVVYNPFWITCGARGVIERNCIPFIVRHEPCKIWVTRLYESFVVIATQSHPILRKYWVRVINQKRLCCSLFKSNINCRREGCISDQHFTFAMLQLKGNHARIQTRINGVQHCAAHRYCIMSFQHWWGIRQHHRNCISAANSSCS